MIVTGVGTREPDLSDVELRAIMKAFVIWANKHNHTLRSGSAVGMDSWFERDWSGPKEIYIPKPVYKPDKNRNIWRRHGVDGAIAHDDPIDLKRAEAIARRIHPNWKAMGPIGKALHTRNVFQVLGTSIDLPSDIIVYYAKFDADGTSVTGGTRTAVMLAREHNIPEYNLILPDDRVRLLDFMDTYDEHHSTRS